MILQNIFVPDIVVGISHSSRLAQLKTVILGRIVECKVLRKDIGLFENNSGEYEVEEFLGF